MSAKKNTLDCISRHVFQRICFEKSQTNPLIVAVLHDLTLVLELIKLQNTPVQRSHWTFSDCKLIILNHTV